MVGEGLPSFCPVDPASTDAGCPACALVPRVGYPSLPLPCWKMAPMLDATSTAILAAIAGGLFGFLAAVLIRYGARAERRREQQRADAAVLGPVMAFLTDADPDRLAFNLRGDAAEQEEVMSPLRERIDNIYGSLLILSAGHPDGRVSELAGQLATAARNAFTSAGLLVNDMLRKSDTSYRDQARADHDEARKLAAELLTEIARYGRRRSRRLALRLANPKVRPEDAVLQHINRGKLQKTRGGPADDAQPDRQDNSPA
jgi:hypothetical protein